LRFTLAESSVLSSFSNSGFPAQSSKTLTQKRADSVFGSTHSPGLTMWVVNSRVGLTSMRTSATGEAPDCQAQLLAIAVPSNVSLHLARAKCKLFPDLDAMAVRRERLTKNSHLCERAQAGFRHEVSLSLSRPNRGCPPTPPPVWLARRVVSLWGQRCASGHLIKR